MKYTLAYCLILILFSACKKETDPRFNISKDGVGLISKTSTIKDLESFFSTDSIVRPSSMAEGQSSSGIIEIYEKGGKQLLSITPSEDSIPGIANIRIHDERFVTPEGINVKSKFKEVRDRLDIKKVITSLNNVVILIRENDLYFTISKEELPSELRFSGAEIDLVQIPDEAEIKYMMVGWN